MTNREEKYREWIGALAFANDGGWSEEVWNAAWDTALLDAANRLEQMFGNADTIASVAIWLRSMKEE
jgi:hypothetical protein